MAAPSLCGFAEVRRDEQRGRPGRLSALARRRAEKTVFRCKKNCREPCSLCHGALSVQHSHFLSYRPSILTGRPRAAGGNAAATLGVPRPGVASSTAYMLRVWAAVGAPCIFGVAWRASLRGRSPYGARAKATKTRKGYKMVQNARGDANCARAQEGGGRGETLFLLSVLSSRD